LSIGTVALNGHVSGRFSLAVFKAHDFHRNRDDYAVSTSTMGKNTYSDGIILALCVATSRVIRRLGESARS
jgi:hypothetical protein